MFMPRFKTLRNSSIHQSVVERLEPVRGRLRTLGEKTVLSGAACNAKKYIINFHQVVENFDRLKVLQEAALTSQYHTPAPMLVTSHGLEKDLHAFETEPESIRLVSQRTSSPMYKSINLTLLSSL